jgi:hypothetical protein
MWPIAILVFAIGLLISREKALFLVYSLSSIILPFYYLVLLIALNELVLR